MGRTYKRISLPWLSIGAGILKKKGNLVDVDFRAAFKMHPRLVQFVWDRLKTLYPIATPDHFLWTLHFLKSRNPDDIGISLVLHTDRKTMKRHVISTLQMLINALPKVCFCVTLCNSSFEHDIIYF
jgi:hypothetical protein